MKNAVKLSNTMTFPQSVCSKLYKLLLMTVFLSSFGLLNAVNVKAAGTTPDVIAPHKALYDIKLVGTKSGSQIVNVTGQMFYEWRPTCDAWTSDHRFNLLYEYSEAPAVQIASDFSTFESFDGTSLDFTSQRKRDGELFEEIRGRASFDENRKGEAIYTKPKGLEYDLPEGSFFPIAHTAAVLEKIRQGKKFFNATIFDGSDEEGPLEVNAFIGKPVDAKSRLSNTESVDMSLLEPPAHDIRLAFFPLNEESATSEYEMNLVFHENGVISDMFIEYEDFSITQKLVALEKLESNCE